MNFATFQVTRPRGRPPKLESGVALESFRCEPYRCVLSRGKCAQRYADANPKPGRYKAGREAIGAKKLVGASCTGCSIGEAHRRGEVPDAAPALARPSTPAGHAPPVRLHVIGDAPSFQANIAKNAAVAKETREQRVRPKQVRDPRTWRKYRPLKPCQRCGKPKGEAIREGGKLCDACLAGKAARRKEYFRTRHHAKRAAVGEGAAA